MATFTINFENQTNDPGNFCVFQRDAGSPQPGLFPLAWRVQPAGAHSKLSISWNTDHYFFWAKTGALKPGVIFNAGQALQTSMTDGNTVKLTKQDGNYQFVDQHNWHQQGMLVIACDYTTAVNQASVGIGLSGAPAFATQAMPNYNVLFAPRLDYWVMFGDFKQGQVLNPDQIDNAHRIEFPYGIFSMEVTLNEDHSWNIEQGLD